MAAMRNSAGEARTDAAPPALTSHFSLSTHRVSLPARLMVRHLRPLALLVALAAFVAVPWPIALAAEKKKSTPVMAPAPPPAMPQTVRVPRGQKIDIPLRIYGRANEPLRYLIRTAPAHGKLSDPRVVEREASAVTYEPPGDFAVKADRFLFSVQSAAGVSAPVEVSINIVDLDPVLAIPASLDFGAILAGATAAKDFTITNRGGGLAAGEVQVPAPWKLEGRSRYQLAAGESAEFKIVFAPATGGEFRGEVQFTSDREHTTALSGTAAAPLSVEPAALELRHEPGFALRTGVFEIVNRTEEARTFQVSAGPRLRVEPQASVPPGGRLAVAVSMPASDVAALDGDAVRVETTGFALRVPVKAVAVGPILRVAQQHLVLGRVPADRGGQMALEVENGGGLPAAVSSEIGAPFALVPPTFLLAPGEKRQVAVLIQPAESGPYRGWLKLKAAPLIAEVEVEAELATGAGNPRSAPGTSRPHRTERKRPEETVELPPWRPDVNVIKAIRVTELQPTGARIEWPADMTPAAKFRIERLMLTRDSAGELGNVWLHVPHVAFSREGPQWFARVSALTPAQSQTLRVVPLDEAGAPGASLFKIDFFTPPAPRRFSPPSLLQWLLLALAVCVGALVWKRRRG